MDQIISLDVGSGTGYQGRMSTNLIDDLKQSLALEGSCVYADQEGKRLFIVKSDMLAMNGERGLLLAYEGEGAMFFDGARPLNVFRLLAAGFNATVAATLADVVNKLCGFDEAPRKAQRPILMLPSEPVRGTEND